MKKIVVSNIQNAEEAAIDLAAENPDIVDNTTLVKILNVGVNIEDI